MGSYSTFDKNLSFPWKTWLNDPWKLERGAFFPIKEWKPSSPTGQIAFLRPDLVNKGEADAFSPKCFHFSHTHTRTHTWPMVQERITSLRDQIQTLTPSTWPFVLPLFLSSSRKNRWSETGCKLAPVQRPTWGEGMTPAAAGCMSSLSVHSRIAL